MTLSASDLLWIFVILTMRLFKVKLSDIAK